MTNSMSTAHDDWQDRIDRFRERNGRPPRVLHVGNIANNAYHNSKMLSSAGIECDVICYDYYHILGCPEWDDADFVGEVEDEFHPRWYKKDLGGFRRPEYFAQGRLKTCIRYLKARHQQKSWSARWWWQCMRLERRFSRLLPRISRLKAVVKIMIYEKCRLHTLIKRTVRIDTQSKRSDDEASRHSSFQELRLTFRHAFPDRADAVREDDFAQFQAMLPAWRKLFAQYDMIVAYATCPILPMLTGDTYMALEHGTLREIPYEDSAIGRLTALSYHLAEHVFVTNTDCLDNAHDLAGETVTFLNHPYDDRQPASDPRTEVLRQQWQEELQADQLFFFPTRHDWIADKGFNDKANDVFLRAFAELRNEGCRVGMICCEWGHNIEESKALLAEQGVAEHVAWYPPMGMVQFKRAAIACGLVVDQFKLGSFGGILFKSLALGVACCTYLDEDEICRRFGEPVPCLNARTAADVKRQLLRLLDEPQLLEELGHASRKWIDTHHSWRDTMAKQLRVMCDFWDQRDGNTSDHYKSRSAA